MLDDALAGSRPDRPSDRPAAALHPARLPKDLHHRRRPQRAAAAHRPGHRRAPRHQRHHGLQGRLPRRGHPSPPGVPRPPPRACVPPRNTAPPPTRNGSEFLGHFERRKVSIGTCGRAFGTGCVHEHACVRCSLLWPDPAQRTGSLEIRDNLHARIAEAEREGWLGEVEGLQVSLAGAEDKLAQIDRRAHHSTRRPRHPHPHNQIKIVPFRESASESCSPADLPTAGRRSRRSRDVWRDPDEVLPMCLEMPGCVGLSLIADRGSGRCIVTTSWDSLESMRATMNQVQPIRQRVAGSSAALTGRRVGDRRDAPRPPRDGRCLRTSHLAQG